MYIVHVHVDTHVHVTSGEFCEPWVGHAPSKSVTSSTAMSPCESVTNHTIHMQPVSNAKLKKCVDHQLRARRALFAVQSLWQ